MNELREKTCREFTELIASTAPAPGGGGASAMVASIGIALGDMVGELTVGKKKYAAVEDDIKALMKRSQELRIRFLQLIDKDAEDFMPLAAAYKIPKDAPGRDEEMEKCLRQAIATPMEILDLACESMEILKQYKEKGSALMVSDADTGMAFIKAAIEGAVINIKVNTKLMKDREFAEKTDREIEEKRCRYC